MTSSEATPSFAQQEAWHGFKPGLWQRDINVRWFIQRNYTPYEGDGAFLAPATERTRRLWKRLEELFVEERKKGVLDISQVPGARIYRPRHCTPNRSSPSPPVPHHLS